MVLRVRGGLARRGTCGTLTISAGWKRMIQDPLATKQRWYCPLCGAKYRVKFGTYCEWQIGETTYSCLASYPPPAVERMQEAVGMTGELVPNWVPPKSPQELLDRIPVAMPMSSVLYSVPGYAGVFKYDKKLFEKMPVMDWAQFFEMSRQAAEGEWKGHKECNRSGPVPGTRGDSTA